MTRPVLVVGSLNLDLVVRCPRAPRPGETLPAHALALVPGGKGANQAAAAARLGAAVRMVGRVGEDAFGERLLEALRAAGVDVSCVARSRRETGTALIVVEESGENRILVVPGANAEVTPQDARESLATLREPVVVLQLEIPLETVLAVARTARAGGATVLLNAAPAQKLPGELLAAVDHLIVNESEAAALLGWSPESPAGELRAVRELSALGPAAVTLTLGARGAVHAGATQLSVRAPRVEVVDTTAAGDAFVGALAAAAARGLASEPALVQAVAAGSLACTREGAQPSLPSAAAVEELARGLLAQVQQ